MLVATAWIITYAGGVLILDQGPSARLLCKRSLIVDQKHLGLFAVCPVILQKKKVLSLIFGGSINQYPMSAIKSILSTWVLFEGLISLYEILEYQVTVLFGGKNAHCLDFKNKWAKTQDVVRKKKESVLNTAKDRNMASVYLKKTNKSSQSEPIDPVGVLAQVLPGALGRSVEEPESVVWNRFSIQSQDGLAFLQL